MNMLNLRNGSCEPEAIVFRVVSNIGVMIEAGDGRAVSDLVRLSNDPFIKVDPVNLEKLKLWGFVASNGDVISSVRNVVLSSCKIVGSDLFMDDPSAPLSDEEPVHSQAI